MSGWDIKKEKSTTENKLVCIQPRSEKPRVGFGFVCGVLSLLLLLLQISNCHGAFTLAVR